MAKLEDDIERQTKEELFSIADYAISISPVDTGAYVESFSMLPSGSGGGRMKNSETLARLSSRVWEGTASRQQFTDIAIANLYGDIEKFDLEGSGKVVLRNRALHARDVEDKHGYGVFTKVRNKFG
ncbi:MAG: hypothetical protein ACSHXL_00295 [Bacteroidota bacterium]